MLKAKFQYWLLFIELNKVQLVFEYLPNISKTYCLTVVTRSCDTELGTATPVLVLKWSEQSIPHRLVYQLLASQAKSNLFIIGHDLGAPKLHHGSTAFLLYIQLCCWLLFIVHEYWRNSTSYAIRFITHLMFRFIDLQ
jgi:hypothetical protein